EKSHYLNRRKSRRATPELELARGVALRQYLLVILKGNRRWRTGPRAGRLKSWNPSSDLTHLGVCCSIKRNWLHLFVESIYERTDAVEAVVQESVTAAFAANSEWSKGLVNRGPGRCWIRYRRIGSQAGGISTSWRPLR